MELGGRWSVVKATEEGASRSRQRAPRGGFGFGYTGVSFGPERRVEMRNVFSSETFRCKKRFSAKRLGSVTDYCRLVSRLVVR